MEIEQSSILLRTNGTSYRGRLSPSPINLCLIVRWTHQVTLWTGSQACGGAGYHSWHSKNITVFMLPESLDTVICPPLARVMISFFFPLSSISVTAPFGCRTSKSHYIHLIISSFAGHILLDGLWDGSVLVRRILFLKAEEHRNLLYEKSCPD